MFSTGKKSCKNPQTMVFLVYINMHIIWAYFNSIEIFKLVFFFSQIASYFLTLLRRGLDFTQKVRHSQADESLSIHEV